ncbi:nucleosome assembly protein [Atractiella rhizophila]|nr:nucleosome assembly protein [Atractiella rhizophila]
MAGGGALLTNMVQSRFNSLLGQSSGYIESLDQSVKSRLTGLKGLQAEQFEIESELKKEILELKKKYTAKFDPLFARRKEIVLGLSEPNDKEFEKGLEEEEKDDDEDDEEESDDEEEEQEKPKSRRATKEEIEKGPKGVPEFWLTAMKNHVGLSDLISERDEMLLKHLIDLRVSYDLEEKGKLGFKLIFEFDKDIVGKDWFDNEGGFLEKTYYYQDKVAYDGDFVYDKAVGTQIKWKEGKDLTVKVEKKRQRNKNTGQTRTIKKTVPTPSFFTFFSPPDPEEIDDEDEDEEDDLRNKLELDYQIGVDIQERVSCSDLSFILFFGEQ